MKEKIDIIIQKMISKDFLAKVVSLLLAVILWAYLITGKTGEMKFRIPIVFKNLATTLMVTDISKKYAIVKLEGKKEYLKNVNVKNIKVYVDLKKPRIGKLHNYRIEIIKNEIPVSISLKLNNSKVKIFVEKKVKKRVKVLAKVIGKVKAGNIIGKIKIFPEKITISGSKSQISKITNIYTVNISLDDKTKDIMEEVELIPLENVFFNEKKVQIMIPIIDFSSLVSFDQPVVIRHIDNNYKYTISKKNVKLYLKLGKNQKIEEKDIEIYVDVRRINKVISKSKKKSLEMNLLIKAIIKNKNIIAVVSIIPDKILVKMERK